MPPSMSEDDVAYTALLRQLLSDNSTTRNARVHSWIEHQYDFALSESDFSNNHLFIPHSRPPSPSPSSSLGAHRAWSSDRPDSPLLPRSSLDSQQDSICPSYDALFFPPSSPQAIPQDDPLEERERERALRFLVQEMAHWKMLSSPTTPPSSLDKPLPSPPPPSPATSVTQSTSSRVMRSRSSSMRISRLPSFTSTLSSDQSQPHDVFTPPLPVSPVVHIDSQHELLYPEFKRSNSFLRRMDSFSQKVHEQDEQELSLLSPIHDDRDSGYPSPTFSNFSCSPSRDTTLTSPCTSLPTSPASPTFAPCLPETIALPASPLSDQFQEEHLYSEDRDWDSFPKSPSGTALPASPSTTVFQPSPSSTTFPISAISPIFEIAMATSPALHVYPASPLSACFPSASKDAVTDPAQPQRLRAHTHSSGDLQSRWSVATTASLSPSPSDSVQSGTFLRSRTPSRSKKDKELLKEVKTPRKRTRLLSFISKLSPGRSENSIPTTPIGSPDYDFANDSDTEEKIVRHTKTISKKSSLASLRASFSVSRASFGSQRPPLSSLADVPPLPLSPGGTSFSASCVSFAVDGMTANGETVPPVPTISLSRMPSRHNMLDDPLPPIPQSASTVTSFQSASQSQVSLQSPPSASASQLSLLPSSGASKISLLPRSGFSSKNSLPLTSALDPDMSMHAVPTSPSKSKSIFRRSTRVKAPKVRAVSGPATPSKLPLPRTGVASPSGIPNGAGALSKIPPPVPAKFTPPSKLASMLASQPSSRLPYPAGMPPLSKLPAPPSRMSPPPLNIVVRSPRTTSLSPIQFAAVDEKLALSNDEPTVSVSKLPLPSSLSKGTRTSTVRGFWRRAQ